MPKFQRMAQATCIGAFLKILWQTSRHKQETEIQESKSTCIVSNFLADPSFYLFQMCMSTNVPICSHRKWGSVFRHLLLLNLTIRITTFPFNQLNFTLASIKHTYWKCWQFKMAICLKVTISVFKVQKAYERK